MKPTPAFDSVADMLEQPAPDTEWVIRYRNGRAEIIEVSSLKLSISNPDWATPIYKTGDPEDDKPFLTLKSNVFPTRESAVATLLERLNEKALMIAEERAKWSLATIKNESKEGPPEASDELLEFLYKVRHNSREAQSQAIRESDDGRLYPVIIALDPVVDGIHETLQLLGLGFMERRPKADEVIRDSSGFM